MHRSLSLYTLVPFPILYFFSLMCVVALHLYKHFLWSIFSCSRNESRSHNTIVTCSQMRESGVFHMLGHFAPTE